MQRNQRVMPGAACVIDSLAGRSQKTPQLMGLRLVTRRHHHHQKRLGRHGNKRLAAQRVALQQQQQHRELAWFGLENTDGGLPTQCAHIHSGEVMKTLCKTVVD